MTSDSANNPYEPSDTPVDAQENSKRVIHSPLVLSIQWTVVLLCNLIAPLYLGWSITQGSGQMGILLAVLVALVFGYWASIYMPLTILFTLRGGLLVALSQFMPILQLIVGLITIEFFRKTRMIPEESLDRGSIGFLGAFLLTGTVGSILMAISCGVGLLLRLITPDRWWLAKRPEGR